MNRERFSMSAWAFLLVACAKVDSSSFGPNIDIDAGAEVNCVTCREPEAMPGDECGPDGSGNCVNVTFDVQDGGGMQCRTSTDPVSCD